VVTKKYSLWLIAVIYYIYNNRQQHRAENCCGFDVYGWYAQQRSK